MSLLRTFLAPVAAAAFVVVAVAHPAIAQQQPTAPGPAAVVPERKLAPSKRIQTAPVIDGVLDDAAWQDAPIISGFVQADPFEGMAASEETEVRVVYDDDAVYVGVMLHDSDPSQIVTTDTRRDSNLNQQDSFQMVFDTFHDLQNGFVFGTNPAGIEYRRTDPQPWRAQRRVGRQLGSTGSRPRERLGG